MDTNIRDILLERNNIFKNKPSLSNFRYNMIEITLPSISDLSINYLDTFMGLTINKLEEARTILKSISNNSKLPLVKEIINANELPQFEITGYNYTKLDTHTDFKNAMMKYYEFFDEIYRKIKDIVSSDDSDEVKVVRLENLEKFSNKLFTKYDEYFSLLDYGFPNKTTFPNYYTGNNVSVTFTYDNKFELLKVYDRVKLCSNHYDWLLKNYETELIKHYRMINEVLTNSMIKDKSLFGIHDDYSMVKNRVNSIVHNELKVEKRMAQIINTILSAQLNSIMDSLRQDTSVLQKVIDISKEEIKL